MVMWKLMEKDRLCREYREALEELPPGMDQAEAFANLRLTLASDVLSHVEGCDICAESTEVFWASRNLLGQPLQVAREERAQDLETGAPWFAARVMALIAEREAEGERAAAEWTKAVARLASRVAWVSAAALLVASTVLYTPQSRESSKQPTMESSHQWLFDGGAQAAVEDALAGPVEK
jgi:hypothetical protein